MLPVLLKGSVVKKPAFFVLSVLCRREKSLYASPLMIPSRQPSTLSSHIYPSTPPPPPPNPAGLSWNHNKDILSGIHLGSPDWRGWIRFFSKHPLSSFPPLPWYTRVPLQWLWTSSIHHSSHLWNKTHIYQVRLPSLFPKSNHVLLCVMKTAPDLDMSSQWKGLGGGGVGMHQFTLNLDVESVPALRRLQLLYVYVEYKPI